MKKSVFFRHIHFCYCFPSKIAYIAIYTVKNAPGEKKKMKILRNRQTMSTNYFKEFENTYKATGIPEDILIWCLEHFCAPTKKKIVFFSPYAFLLLIFNQITKISKFQKKISKFFFKKIFKKKIEKFFFLIKISISNFLVSQKTS